DFVPVQTPALRPGNPLGPAYQALKRTGNSRVAVAAPRPLPAVLLKRPEFVYSAALFLIAAYALVLAIDRTGAASAVHRPGAALSFLLCGLLTITTGYHPPRVGHVSFDRVSQVAIILVLGPITAAIVNGLASLIYPWHRIWRGHSLARVLTASLNNAG